MPDHEVVLLAALIADGNLTERTPRFCSGAGFRGPPVVEQAASELGLKVHDGGRGTATISAGRGGPPNPLTAILRRHGLWGLRSGEKFVPEAVFALGDEQIARFLSVLYACDGHVYSSERDSQIGYTTISERLAHDVQHLLLRLGIVGAIRTLHREVYEGTDVAREVRITDRAGLEEFCPPGPGHRQAVRPRARDDARRGAGCQLEPRHAPRGRVGSGHRVQGQPLVGRDQRGRRPTRGTTTGTSVRAACRAPSSAGSLKPPAAASSRRSPPRTCGGTRSRRSSISVSRRPTT